MKERSQRRLRGGSALLAMAALAVSTAVWSKEPSKTVQRFDIPAQSTGDALNAFSKQSGLRLLFSYDAVEGRQVGAISGEFTAEEALEKILAGTGLHYELTADSVVLIRSTEQRSTGAAAVASAAAPLRVAQAETAGQGESAPEASAAGESPPAEPGVAAAGAEVLEEITVTAQRRVERLQDVPISISVLDGDALDSSTDRGIADALSRVPGVINAVSSTTARNGSNAGTVVVRGVAPDQGSGTTAYYLDSIPFGFVKRFYQPDATAYDLERVEVLRGPQGTLYGLSSLNGVVRVLTKDADLDRFEFKARGSVSGTEDGGENYRGDAAINVPIVSGKLAIRAVAGYQDIGGWIDKPIRKDANDAQVGNYRLKINAQPTDQLSIGMLAWFSRADIGAASNTADGLTSISVLEEPSSTDYDAYGLKVGYDFARVSLTSMSSYIDFSNPAKVDFSPFIPSNYLNLQFDSEVFSQEITLNSRGEGPWRWSVGGIYRDAEDVLFTTRTNPATGALSNPPYLAPTIQTATSESFAAFGEVTREFLDGRWDLTVGARYFEDVVEDPEISRNTFIGGTVPPPALAGQTLADPKGEFDHTAPRIVLSWHPAGETTLYTSYGEGFRSGINQLPAIASTFPGFPPAEPDVLKNYEVGAKGSLLGSRFNYNAAIFYMDWRDVQQSVPVVVDVPTSFIQSAFINAGDASGAGFEFALTMKPAKGLTLGASYSWNDLKLDEDITPVNATVPLFAKGGRLGFSPKYTASASADYAFPLGAGGYRGRMSASVSHMAERISDRADANTLFFADAVTLGRASLAVESGGHWTAALFVDNLSNEKGHTNDRFSDRWDTYVRPRTAGLQFEYRY